MGRPPRERGGGGGGGGQAGERCASNMRSVWGHIKAFGWESFSHVSSCILISSALPHNGDPSCCQCNSRAGHIVLASNCGNPGMRSASDCCSQNLLYPGGTRILLMQRDLQPGHRTCCSPGGTRIYMCPGSQKKLQQSLASLQIKRWSMFVIVPTPDKPMEALDAMSLGPLPRILASIGQQPSQRAHNVQR